MKTKRTLLILIVIAILIGVSVIYFKACFSNEPTASNVKSPTTTKEVTSKPLTAEEITSKLKSGGAPIGDVIVYNKDTDVNHLLGNPNQYVSKVNFADTNIEQLNPERPKGGTIETFNNSADLNTRKNYVESVEKDSPVLKEYIIANGNYLLRLNNELTAEQVEAYKKIFMSIK